MSDEPFLLLQFKDSNSIYYFFFIIGKNLGILVFTIMTYVLYASGSKIYGKPLQGAVLAPISSAKFLGKVTTSSPEKRTILLMVHAFHYTNEGRRRASKLRKESHHASCKRDRIVPLAGNPYFTSIFVKSQISELVIPKCFRHFLPNYSVQVILSCGDRSWRVKYSGQLFLKRITTGWREFALDNKLKVGDGCIYELLDRKHLEFRVQILRGEVPPMFACDLYGRSSDRPVIID
ncbi:B3 domain-containing protein Os04g0386900-like [Asparagus officinalis]|uniref:B3 domain-containing protein Os04g0386900-like n=1 Tax=Asparagus officinalis TaxID=4686 RepID=UPI00098E4171|nr:B3 domain-containing protein Os04g0386900-like [Asparagus officinalis]